MSIEESVSIIAALISIALGALAIGLSLWIFRQTKDTEKEVSNALTKIESQTDMLQKITGKQLDRLTKYVTEPKSDKPDEQLTELIKVFAQLPQMLLTPAMPGISGPTREQYITLLIALYFYTAQINALEASSLPTAEEFDATNAFHSHIKRIIDMSAADFHVISTEISNINPDELKKFPTYPLVEETKDNWGFFVKASSEIYIQRAHLPGEEN